MNEQILLTRLTAISQKYDLLNKNTGGYFNIFDIANVSHNEVITCRVLHELLSPKGSHHQGNIYLKLFFRNVLQIEISDSELETAKVHREYLIDENRRIDLVIETATQFIPIEVKIYSGEQYNQCYDYYLEAKKHQASPFLCYLTRFGESPSEHSASGLTKNDNGYVEIVNISFSENILNWLDLCLKQTATIKIAPIREVLLQFIGVIRKFTEKTESDKEMEIKDLLLSSKENMKSAISVISALEVAKEELIINLFKTIEQKVKKVKIDKLINQYDVNDNNSNKIKTFYNRKNPTYPGISYLYKKNVKSDVDIWVRLEIEEDIFVGYCCPIKGKAGKQPLAFEEIKTLMNVEPYISNWWAYYEMCFLDNESPDFRGFNDAYYELFDNAKFEKFTDTVAERIIFLLHV